MSFPKAQYKLHPVLPQIIEGDKGYYFGATYCTKDLKPVDLLRVPPPNAGLYSNRQALSLRGRGLAIQRTSTYSTVMNGCGGLHTTLGISDRLLQPFSSASGSTSGRRFIVTAGGTLCDIDENDVLIPRAVMNTSFSTPAFVAGFVFAENANSLFVFCASRDVVGSSSAADQRRLTIYIVSKSDFSSVPAFTEQSTGAASSQWSSVFKNARYFGEIDGKHLFALSAQNNTSSSFMSMSLFAITAVDGKAFYGSSGLTLHVAANYNVLSTLSGLVPKAGAAGEFFTIVPGANPAAAVTISKFVIPSEIAISTAAVSVIPGSGASTRTNMTLVGMPDGVQMMPCYSAVSGTYSSMFAPFVTTGANGKRYLNVMSMYGGAADQENYSGYAIANIGLFTFEIADDGTSLIYKSHTLGGFGYGLRINEFLTDDTGRTLILANSTGFAVWTWSDVTNTYIKGEWRVVPAGLRRLHLDSAYKIWVEDQDNSVFVFDMDLSASVNITFDRAAVTYEGTTVPIKAYVDALSFAGSRIARNVRLVATGCTFDDGSVVKVVNTLTTGALEVPLFVNGGGNVSLNGYLL